MCRPSVVDHPAAPHKASRQRKSPGAATLRSPAAQVHNGQMFDWNDLRYFLAVARHHSTIAAGKSLGLSQSTVQRRVNELERRIGRPLFGGDPARYARPEFGEGLAPFT